MLRLLRNIFKKVRSVRTPNATLSSPFVNRFSVTLKVVVYRSLIITTEMYSLKSCVINFHTQTSSSHSEGRCFFTCLVQWKATAECEFGAEFPAFNRCLQLAPHSLPRLASRKCKLLLRRLTFSRSFSRRNVKNISEIGVELSQRCCILITA